MTDARRTDTREQIREVALELFAERGYEGTSLREIAERLGITKAAVYYHYKTKEEIVGALFDDFLAGIDEIVEWAQGKGPGPETRAEVLRRYQGLLSAPSAAQVARLMQEGQSSLRDVAAAKDMKARFFSMSRAVIDPDASAADQMRMRLAVIALHLGAFMDQESLPVPPAERSAVALQIALELAGG
ncbi:TetR/AcrR family transcriptional regulator [Pseudonocardia sp. N23]|uniref:TetR/AcrR family transcriptional regulator n=1 Tax=Pseudonocardia sp. N23 TaxID=1987376 RepID=UPI000BFD02C3|nr:TetR/AcrR family transcriptional regulator [Pseudonocardia sp. N23]GAY08340.1 transcriptional regulator, tetr family [Pseudonocardia sp. N23]